MGSTSQLKVLYSSRRWVSNSARDQPRVASALAPASALTPSVVTVVGEIAPGDTTTLEAAYPDPAAAYLYAVVEALATRGITVRRGVDAAGRVAADSLTVKLGSRKRSRRLDPPSA